MTAAKRPSLSPHSITVRTVPRAALKTLVARLVAESAADPVSHLQRDAA